MNRLRVVHLIDNLGFAGAERVALDMVTSLDPERFERILCVTRNIPLPAARIERLRAFEAEGGVVVQLDRRGPWDLAAWRPLVTLLRGRRPDVIHGHMIGSSVWAVAVGRLLRVPVIVAHDHGSPPEPGLRLRAVERALALGSHMVITVSRAERRRWIEMAGARPERVRVVPNAVAFAPPSTPVDLRSELGLADDAWLVGCVGHLRPEKAQVVLVEAARALRDTHPSARVLLVGPGPEREHLERAIAESGLQDRVFLLGLREDVPAIVAALDVAVLCSDREGVPLSILEYMQAARPIVATRVGGVPEVIGDGEQGLLVAPRDSAALAAAIGRLLDDRPLALRLGERALERAHAEFDPSAVIRQVEALYAGLVAEAQRRS
ncbi:MAG: glycosyltransferase [Solirubrobacteraceae bacterium]|nr:glycosyltransferase [Solirubrobacteraceae bacterium]